MDFQQRQENDNSTVQQEALGEFDKVIEALKENDVSVIVIEDSPSPGKPDAVFPNNWISTHPDGTIVIYPMMAANRRSERREDIVRYLKANYQVTHVLDMTGAEWDNQFLEGTGSIVFDHTNKLAYACRSPRTSESLLMDLCQQMGYKPIVFDAVDEAGLPIYHTNVVMWIGEKTAGICLDAIKNESDQDKVLDALSETNHKIIALSFSQVMAFAGNMFEVQNKSGQVFLLMSTTAYHSLLPGQINEMSKYAELLIFDIDTIQKHGGGGIRCMVAGIYLPQKSQS